MKHPTSTPPPPANPTLGRIEANAEDRLHAVQVPPEGSAFRGRQTALRATPRSHPAALGGAKDGRDGSPSGPISDFTPTPSPLAQIHRLYAITHSPRTFAEDLATHLRTGCVISTPSYFAMGRPVPHTAHVAQINDPSICFPPGQCDTWYIYALAGDWRAALGSFPYPLPYLAFERANQNGLRFWPLARFLQKAARPTPAPSLSPQSHVLTA